MNLIKNLIKKIENYIFFIIPFPYDTIFLVTRLLCKRFSVNIISDIRVPCHQLFLVSQVV